MGIIRATRKPIKAEEASHPALALWSLHSPESIFHAFISKGRAKCQVAMALHYVSLRLLCDSVFDPEDEGAANASGVQSQGVSIVRPGSQRGRGEAPSDWKREQGLALARGYCRQAVASDFPIMRRLPK